MKEKVLAILSKSHPEFDFTEEGIDFIEQGMLDSFEFQIDLQNLKSALQYQKIGRAHV